jgi:hypothetical protein
LPILFLAHDRHAAHTFNGSHSTPEPDKSQACGKTHAMKKTIKAAIRNIIGARVRQARLNRKAQSAGYEG